MFEVGDTVRMKDVHPPTHTRLPQYVRGHIGRIEHNHGCHVFADLNSLGVGEKPAMALYCAVRRTGIVGQGKRSDAQHLRRCLGTLSGSLCRLIPIDLTRLFALFPQPWVRGWGNFVPVLVRLQPLERLPRHAQRTASCAAGSACSKGLPACASSLSGVPTAALCRCKFGRHRVCRRRFAYSWREPPRTWENRRTGLCRGRKRQSRSSAGHYHCPVQCSVRRCISSIRKLDRPRSFSLRGRDFLPMRRPKKCRCQR